MKDNFLKLQYNVMNKCQEYYDEYSKIKNKKHGVIWLKNEETGQLMVYTRGEYTEKILEFLNTL